MPLLRHADLKRTGRAHTTRGGLAEHVLVEVKGSTPFEEKLSDEGRGKFVMCASSLEQHRAIMAGKIIGVLLLIASPKVALTQKKYPSRPIPTPAIACVAHTTSAPRSAGQPNRRHLAAELLPEIRQCGNTRPAADAATG